MARRITERVLRCGPTSRGVRLAGWLSGRQTYLWLGDPDHDGSAWATLDGRSLYRLAKAIVREFEREGT
jgi:hypothetical protein